MEGMRSANGLPCLKSFHRPPVSPFPFLHISSDLEHVEGGNYHQRCSSDSILFDEEPAWLDDLLDEPDTHFHKAHRRSASDSDACLGAAAEILNIRQESKNLHSFDRAPGTKTNMMKQPASFIAVEYRKDDTSSQNSSAQARPCGSKTDINRSKKNNAQRSRVRKLEYIANLERTAHILKVEGTGISVELEFVEQQNIILSMENRALRQHLESISQEQMIKQWEQGMLEREITRLQSLYHLQQQQQMHLQLQQQQSHGYQSKQGRNKINSYTSKNKDTNPNKAPVIAAIRA